VEHQLALRIPATLVIQVVVFHAYTVVHVVLLAVHAEGGLPLVRYLYMRLPLYLISICHLDCCLSSLLCGLPSLAVASRLLGDRYLHFGILLCVLVLHSLFVAQAGFGDWVAAVGALLAALYLHLIQLIRREHRPNHLLTHLHVLGDSDGALRYRVIRQLTIVTTTK
jgi:hypothetical protein